MQWLHAKCKQMYPAMLMTEDKNLTAFISIVIRGILPGIC